MDQAEKILTRASFKVLLGVLGGVCVLLGFLSPPALNPNPATQPYLRGLGVVFLGIGLGIDLADKTRFPRNRWMRGLFAAGVIGLAIVFAVVPLALRDTTAIQSDGLVDVLMIRVAAIEDGVGEIRESVGGRLDEIESRVLDLEAKSEALGPELVELSEPQEPGSSPSGTAVSIEGGSFLIGSDILGSSRGPYPQHQETLSAYRIGIYEVTNGKYEECVLAGVCLQPARTSSATRQLYYGNDEFADYPVIWVSFDKARTYCEWLGGDLPTEEQWERAARGSNGLTYPWGNIAPSPGYANLAFAEEPNDTSRVGQHAIDSSEDGIFDMGGNVAEWTLSWFSSYEGNAEPFDFTGELRVIRGGNFSSEAESNPVKSYLRGQLDPFEQAQHVGFRCAWREEAE